jgi:hypothetical protein
VERYYLKKLNDMEAKEQHKSQIGLQPLETWMIIFTLVGFGKVLEYGPCEGGSFVTTPWHILRLQMRRRPSDMERNCKCIE